MENLHQYAVSLEFTLRKIFECDRGGLGGLIDADSIEGGSMFTLIVSALSQKYIGTYNIKSIDTFIENNFDIESKGFREMGEERIIKVIDEFEKLYKSLG